MRTIQERLEKNQKLFQILKVREHKQLYGHADTEKKKLKEQ